MSRLGNEEKLIQRAFSVLNNDMAKQELNFALPQDDNDAEQSPEFNKIFSEPLIVKSL